MLQDRFGNDIKIGSTITYPQRSGSHLWVVDGVVTKIEGDRIYVRREKTWSMDKGIGYTSLLDRVTVVILPTPGNQHEMGS